MKKLPKYLRLKTPLEDLEPSPKVKEAINLMVTQALTRPQAAERVGIKDHTLYVMLKKPHCVAYKNRVLYEYKRNLSERALHKVGELSDRAKSEYVQLDASKTLLSIDERFISVSKQIHSGTIEHKITPGYVIDLSEEPELKTIDGELIK